MTGTDNEGSGQAGSKSDTIQLHKLLDTPEKEAELLAKVGGSDLIVLAFPLYVDSLPWPVTRALELIAEHRGTASQKRPGFMVLCNCGFPEASQTSLAIRMCRVFASQADMEWLGGLALGAGGAIAGRPLQDLGGMVRNVTRALDMTATTLAKGDDVPEAAIELLARSMMPRRLYLMGGDHGWKKAARRNGVKGRLCDRPYRRSNG